MSSTSGASRAEAHLVRARALVAALERGDTESAVRLIDELANVREARLFRRIAELEPAQRESLAVLCAELGVDDLALNRIPAARQRLQHVERLARESAHRTLDAVERCAPLLARLSREVEALSARIGAGAGEAGRQPQAVADSGLEEFLAHSGAYVQTLRGCLSDVLVAQENEDLGGQLIQPVIGLIDEMEVRLSALAALAGERADSPPPATAAAMGPAVPGTGGDRVSGQEEVDQLLERLGC